MLLYTVISPSTLRVPEAARRLAARLVQFGEVIGQVADKGQPQPRASAQAQ